MISKLLSSPVEVWLEAGSAAFIAGGSTAMSTWGGLAIIQSLGAKVPSLDFRTGGILFAAAGLHSFFLYLMKSPLPGVTAPIDSPPKA
jgi:hypothetical protein